MAAMSLKWGSWWKTTSGLKQLRGLLVFQTRNPASVVLCQTYSKSSTEDPNDPKVAAWNQKLHVETPTKHHPDVLSVKPVKGKIFEKLPFRIKLEAGKTYAFCTCGFSKKQPFCDSSHKAPFHMSTRPQHVKYRPVRFKVEETKEYWLCMCKQTDNPPFCDGSHKKEAVQSAIR